MAIWHGSLHPFGPLGNEETAFLIHQISGEDVASQKQWRWWTAACWEGRPGIVIISPRNICRAWQGLPSQELSSGWNPEWIFQTRVKHQENTRWASVMLCYTFWQYYRLWVQSHSSAKIGHHNVTKARQATQIIQPPIQNDAHVTPTPISSTAFFGIPSWPAKATLKSLKVWICLRIWYISSFKCFLPRWTCNYAYSLVPKLNIERYINLLLSYNHEGGFHFRMQAALIGDWAGIAMLQWHRFPWKP